MSMAFYAVGLLPLIREVKGVEGLKSVLQMWYADDVSAGGCINKLIELFRLLITRGPDFGYFPEPSKSIVVVALYSGIAPRGSPPRPDFFFNPRTFPVWQISVKLFPRR